MQFTFKLHRLMWTLSGFWRSKELVRLNEIKKIVLLLLQSGKECCCISVHKTIIWNHRCGSFFSLQPGMNDQINNLPVVHDNAMCLFILTIQYGDLNWKWMVNIQTWCVIFEEQIRNIETKEQENVIKGSTNHVEPEKTQRRQSVSKED